MLRLPAGDWTTWHIVNADEPRVVVQNADREAFTITIRDHAGRIITKARGPLPVELEVPTGGLATLERSGLTPEPARIVTI